MCLALRFSQADGPPRIVRHDDPGAQLYFLTDDTPGQGSWGHAAPGKALPSGTHLPMTALRQGVYSHLTPQPLRLTAEDFLTAAAGGRETWHHLGAGLWVLGARLTGELESACYVITAPTSGHTSAWPWVETGSVTRGVF